MLTKESILGIHSQLSRIQNGPGGMSHQPILLTHKVNPAIMLVIDMPIVGMREAISLLKSMSSLPRIANTTIKYPDLTLMPYCKQETIAS